ncbi:hypothetical protein [Lysobacter sp. F6437]|uniref:hypothetical protein n=1 Tax=Lysobacter sp. F6437 TaxID=3459296 RepID=UPI00403D7FF0
MSLQRTAELMAQLTDAAWFDERACAAYLGITVDTDVSKLPGFPPPDERGLRHVLDVEEWAQSTRAETETALYRHYDGRGALLYVGISLCAIYRLSQHRRKPWSRQIARVSIEWHPTRSAALAAEKKAIKRERPIHNVIGARRG